MKRTNHWYQSFTVAALSLALLGGCENTEVDNPTPPADRLYFNATLDGRPVGAAATRAYNGDIDFATRGFTVAGYYTAGAFSTDNANNLPYPNVFDYKNPGVNPAVLTVTKNSDESNPDRQYSTPLPRLPLSNLFNLSFFAWSSSIDGAITSATNSASDKGAPWLTVKMLEVHKPQPDIVGAASLNHSNEYTVSAVDLDFKHLLSKMSFLVKPPAGARIAVTVVKCRAKGILSEGTFTFDGTENMGTWSYNSKNKVTTSYETLGWTTEVATATAPLGSLTFIPQKLEAEAVSLDITYVLISQDNVSQETTSTVSLEAIDMQPGKNYVYTVEVTANKMEAFDVKVEDWMVMQGIDGDLPLVPGEMNPNVLLLLDGHDPPYTASDGKQYWLDRSGWNNHCLIIDKTQYNGTNAFDITYDEKAKGYRFNRPNFYDAYLYNHIRVPDLGKVARNISCEIVYENTSVGWGFPMPFIISQAERAYGEYVYKARTLLCSIGESQGTVNNWDYAADLPNSDSFDKNFYERLSHPVSPNYNWNKRSFYAYSRANLYKKFSVIDNTSYAESFAADNSQEYPLKHGMIGAAFQGVINYVKVLKEKLSHDQVMEDYDKLATKYRIGTVPGKYAPEVEGLLACWDARTGLVNPGPNGEGGYWMDQSGNGYYLRAHVPQNANPKASITYDPSKKAIVFTGPKYSNESDSRPGTYMINTRSMGKTMALTFEMVYRSVEPNVPFALEFAAENYEKRSAFFRPNTGLDKVSVAGSMGATYQPAIQDGNIDLLARRSLVGVIDGNKGQISVYHNGELFTSSSDTGKRDPLQAPLDLAITILGNSYWTKPVPFTQAFTGEMHAFRVYNRALTADEIKKNYEKDKENFSIP